MVQLELSFKSWVPDSVFSAGEWRSSFEAWSPTALDIEECLAGAVDSDVHLFVADVIKFFDTVECGIFWTGFLVVWGCLVGLVMLTLNIMLGHV